MNILYPPLQQINWEEAFSWLGDIGGSACFEIDVEGRNRLTTVDTQFRKQACVPKVLLHWIVNF